MPITIDGDGTITGVSVGGLPDGIVDADMLASNAVTTAKISDSQITEAKLASDQQKGLAKAWVNFNGTGTVAIRDNLNVSSITDNGTGNYTVTFTTAMPDTNYATFCNDMFDDDSVNNGGGVWANLTRFAQTTTQVRVVVESSTSTLYDSKIVNVVVFGS